MSKLVIIISKHRSCGSLLIPYHVENKFNGAFLSTIGIAKEGDLYFDQLSDDEKAIINIASEYNDRTIYKKFSDGKGFSNFFDRMSKEHFDSKVAPFIDEIIIKMINHIKSAKLPIYHNNGSYSHLYPEDCLDIVDSGVTAHYNFRVRGEETRYSFSLLHNRKRVELNNRDNLILSNTPCSLIADGKLILLKDIPSSAISPFLKKEYIATPSHLRDRYYRSFVKNAVKRGSVQGALIKVETGDLVPKAEATLIKIDGKLKVDLQFNYGGDIIRESSIERAAVAVSLDSDGIYNYTKYRRDSEYEQSVVDSLNKIGKVPTDIHDAVDWVSKAKPILSEMGITIDDSCIDQFSTDIASLDFSFMEEGDWFDIKAVVHIGEFIIPFIKFKTNIINRIREFVLPDGKLFIIPVEWFVSYCDIMGVGKVSKEKLRLNRAHYNLLESSVLTTGDIGEVEKRSFAKPEIVQAELRDYQHQGYEWFSNLNNAKFGGCLADDMGLGKTLQTLTYLASLKRDQLGSLIILPTTLIHNWIIELKRFVPSLSYYCYLGPNRSKTVNLAEKFGSVDIIFTTYGIVRNDIELLESYKFMNIILDEGQYIKNYSSLIYKAVIRLQCRNRFVLTGTPIENSLSDLWAQMNFLNPGILGSYRWFKREYLTAIEKLGDQSKIDSLKKIIDPFILRRTKREVAKELPDLIEQISYVKMSSEQSSVYEKEKSAVRNSFMDQISSGQAESLNFMALQGLTRLRQIANHPSMVGYDEIDSGKFERVISMIKTLRSEGSKVLIFSSFVKSLKLFSSYFKENEWGYSMLTGEDRDREGIIDQFKRDEDRNIFLISLKAGGVGLNLTEAGYVFILDPWWNPAAEAQAINRAHRIGQNKTVFVYRFISEDTVEEKIERLKKRKSDISDLFISSSNPLRNISSDDIVKLLD